MQKSSPAVQHTAVLVVFALFLEFSCASSSPYPGIVTHLVFPTFLSVGVVIFHKTRDAAIEHGVSVVVDLFDRSVFPAPTVGRTTYADILGHHNWPGSFRRRDGMMTHYLQGGSCASCHGFTS